MPREVLAASRKMIKVANARASRRPEQSPRTGHCYRSGSRTICTWWQPRWGRAESASSAGVITFAPPHFNSSYYPDRHIEAILRTWTQICKWVEEMGREQVGTLLGTSL